MQAMLNPKTKTFQFSMEPEDEIDFFEVQKTMHTKGWAVLEKQWEGMREQIIDLIKSCPKSRAKIAITPTYASKLDGFDEFSAVPMRMVELLKTYMENKHNEEENV